MHEPLRLLRPEGRVRSAARVPSLASRLWFGRRRCARSAVGTRGRDALQWQPETQVKPMRRLLLCVMIACLSMTVAAQRGERRAASGSGPLIERRNSQAETDGPRSNDMRQRVQQRMQGRGERVRERLQEMRQRLQERRAQRPDGRRAGEGRGGMRRPPMRALDSRRNATGGPEGQRGRRPIDREDAAGPMERRHNRGLRAQAGSGQGTTGRSPRNGRGQELPADDRQREQHPRGRGRGRAAGGDA